MTELTMEKRLSPVAIAVEQIRTVGLAMRRELGLVLGAAALSLIPLMWVDITADGWPPVLDPGDGLGWLAVALGVFLPLLVWKGERPFGDSHLWRLPADHRGQALAKVGAGWLWLMLLVGVGLSWMVLVVASSGGELGVEQLRRVIVDPAAAAAGEVSAFDSVQWTTAWWQWLTPFAAATVAYLAASALLLGTRHLLWWIGGLWLGGLLVGGAAEADIEPFAGIVGFVRRAADVVVTGGHEALRTRITFPWGEPGWAWTSLPSGGAWLGVTALWLGLAALALLAAVSRSREA
jgi:hypothetical protein